MPHLERQIASAQHRLWINRWISEVCRTAALGALAYAGVVLVQRLYDAPIPLGWVAIGLGCFAVAVSTILTILRREDCAAAAVRLDAAAGLRERLSTGHYCLNSDDPFAQAVVADAERRCTGLSARRHIRLGVPGILPWTMGSLVLAALMFLISPGLLAPEDAQAGASETEVNRTKAAVAKQIQEVKKLVESTPALEDLRGKLEGSKDEKGGKLMRASDLRHTAIKKIDTLADAIKKKRENKELESPQAMRKMMRGLKNPNSPQAATKELTDALKQGDFKKAQEEVEALKQALSALKAQGDQEAVEKMGKQLDELAKQIEKLAKNEGLAKKLEQMGLSKEQVDNLLKNASKKKMQELAERLAEKGLSQQQIQSIKNQVSQQQQSGPMAQKLAEALGKSASATAQGDSAQGMAGLTMAGQQLSELEMLEQQMSELDAAMDATQQAKNSLDKPCEACGGSGSMGGQQCPTCAGSGSSAGRQASQQGSGEGQGGMGQNPGQGRGSIASEQRSSVAFKTERGKVPTGRGSIIGQFRVDGEQVKGDVSDEVTELMTAAQRDASDRINRDRLPRQYQKAVKSYFASAEKRLKKATAGAKANKEREVTDQDQGDSDSTDDASAE